MKFASRLFRAAGIYGLIVIAPQYFLESRVGQDLPPPVTHPEYFYGFAGVALAWQLAFLVIGHDPVRFRPLMIPAVVEKWTFGIAAIALFAAGRIPAVVLAFGLVDFTLGILFLIAWLRLRPGSPSPVGK